MKRVIKGPEPESFAQWKAAANEDWQPTFDGLANPQKSDLLQSLVGEQGSVCCYCGGRISNAVSHIEHFKPQHPFEDLALDYGNLFASCLRETRAGTPLHCGHAKGDQFGPEFISPLDPDCEERFVYTDDGRVLAEDLDDVGAASMIKALKLDSPNLRANRAEAIAGVFTTEVLATLSAADLARIAASFGSRDAQGNYRSFGHAVVRYANRFVLGGGGEA